MSKLVLNATARSAIVHSFVQSYDAAENTGSHVTHVCDTARRFLKGDPVSKDDADAIIKDVANKRGWKGDTLRARSSEVRIVLRAYAKLPEAMESLKAKVKSCTWHAGLKLARALNGKAEGNIAKAVRMVAEAGANSGAKMHPTQRAAGALKAWYKVAKGEKRAVILQAAALMGLKLGIKLDA